MVLIGVFAVVFAYKKSIKIWFLTRPWLRRFFKSRAEAETENFVHDVFLLHAEEDFDFALNTLASKLETDGFKCQFKARFVEGCNMSEQVSKAIEESRKTILLLSKNFVKAETYESDFLATQARKWRLIVVCLGDLPSKREMGQVMFNYYVRPKNFIKVDGKNEDASFRRIYYEITQYQSNSQLRYLNLE